MYGFIIDIWGWSFIMQNKLLIAGLLVLSVTALFAAPEKYTVILGGKNKDIEEGFVFGNKYCQIAFLNPSLHGGGITGGDFNIMQRRDVTGKHTLDESEACHRIFFKPDVKVSSTGRRVRAVYGSENWALTKIDKGVNFHRKFVSAACSVSADIAVTFDPEKAQVFCRATIKNNGSGSAKVEVLPEFIFLRNDIQPLELIMERAFVRYENGKRKQIRGYEKTLLGGGGRDYWWRRVARDCKDFTNYFNRERIPFTHARLVPPQQFGITGLAGKGTLIWDLGENPAEKITYLDVIWEAVRGNINPAWRIELKGGEQKNIEFRMLTLRGLTRFDSVNKDWVFSFQTGNDLCVIQSVPLKPQDKLTIAATVNDSRNNQVVINQRSELAAMTPFTPSRVEWRSAAEFQNHVIYPVKLTIGTFGGQNIMDAGGSIIP